MSAGARSQLSPLHHPAIEAIWIAAAQEIGWTVARTSAAFATSDGQRTISIGVDEVLDGDDAVAQLVFHELCHGLVQGPASWSQPDWGLSNEEDRDVIAEHACLRTQIHLTAPHGLRAAMAPTTEYRAYHDAVTGDPLQAPGDPAAARARQALERPESRLWIAALERALARTRLVLDGVASAGEPVVEASLGSDGANPNHPVGFPWGPPGETCGGCAWLYVGGRGPGVERCRQSGAESAPEGQRTSRHERACERWEPPVDCQTCGACCREAYHSVTVSVRDPVVWKQPALIVRHGHRFEILRNGPRCAALHDRREERPPAGELSRAAAPASQPAASGGDGAGRVTAARAAATRAAIPPTQGGAPTFACTIYEDRPRACRDFEAGGRHCLVARRRVGLSV